MVVVSHSEYIYHNIISVHHDACVNRLCGGKYRDEYIYIYI